MSDKPCVHWIGSEERHCGATPTRHFLPGHLCAEHQLSVPIGPEMQPRSRPEAVADPQAAQQRPGRATARTEPTERPTPPQEPATPEECRDAVADAAARGFHGATVPELEAFMEDSGNQS